METESEGPETAPEGPPLLQNRAFLDLFWDLAKPEQEVRLRAVESLVQHLKTHNKEEELEYSLTRLVTGLSHSRETARPAFSLALGQVLSAFTDLSLLQTLDRIRDKHNLQKVKKKLQRNAMFGNLFGVLALHQSGRLTQEPEAVLACVQLLQTLTPHRQYLRDLPTKTMMDILNQVEEQVFEQVLFSALQSDLATPFRTPEQLHLLLVALQRFPNSLKPKKLKKLLGFSSIIHQDNVPRLTELLKTVAMKKEHALPPVILDLLKLSLKENSFHLFWTNVITEGLLKEPPGPTHYLSFRLLGASLPLLSEEQLSEVLSGDVMRLYGQHVVMSQKPGRFRMSPEMDAYVSAFLLDCESEAHQLLVVRAFSCLSHQGCPVVPPTWRAVQHLSPPALQAYITWLCTTFLRPQRHVLLEVTPKKPRDEKDDSWVNRLRKWIGARLVALVDNQQLKKEEEMITQVSRFLLFHAFFSGVAPDLSVTSEELSVPLQEDTKTALANSFFSLLLSLHHLPQEQGPEEESGVQRRPLGLRADGSMWISHLFDSAQTLLQHPQVETGSAFGASQRQAWDSLLVSVSGLRKKMKKGQTAENKAFLQLFLLLGLYLFKAPEELLDIIRDLQSCVDRAHKKKKKQSQPGEEQEPAWVEVLVELLLSLLSQPSKHMRQVCKMVFSSICPHVTQAALSAILKVLEPEPDEEDSGLLITDEDPGKDQEDDEEEEEEEEAEEENKQEEGSDSDDDEEDEDDEDEDGKGLEEEEEEENEEQEVDPEFRLKLMKVLEQQNALAKEEDSSGDEDLDDEAMMKLDQSLAAVFLEQKKKTQAKKDEKSKLKKEKVLIRDFKIKVLDLLEVFVSRQGSSRLVLTLIQPLLALIERCMSSDRELLEQDLLRRTANILRNDLFRAKAYCRSLEDGAEELHELLEMLLNKTLRLHDSSVALYYFSACLYLVKVLRGAPPPRGPEDTADNVGFMGDVDVQRVSSLFSTALASFFSRRKSPLTCQMFSDLFTRFPVLCVDLVDTAVKNMTTGVRDHQQGQACVLVLRALQSREVQLLLQGEAWTQLCSRVTAQLVTSVQQMCGSEQKTVKDKLQQVLELSLCVLGHAHRQKLPLDLQPLRSSLQDLSSSVSFSKTGRLEDTYWAVMKRLGVMKPKTEKVKSNPADDPKTAMKTKKKKKGFLPETKKRKKRTVLETTDAAANAQPPAQRDQTEKTPRKNDMKKKKAAPAKNKRPAEGAPTLDTPTKKSKISKDKKKKKQKVKAASHT